MHPWRANGMIALLLGLAIVASGQTPSGFAEGEMFVADRGNMNNSNDGGINRYSHTFSLLQSLPLTGSGSIRGLSVAVNGDVFVARGDDVIRWERTLGYMCPMVVATGVKTQDIVIHPVTGNLWVTFGTDNMTAEVREISPAGATLQSFTDALLVHPRSIALDHAGDNLYIANGTGVNVLEFDLPALSFSIHADLSAQPNGFNATGISVDAPGSVYVSGSWGLTQRILQLSGNPAVISTFLDYSLAPGLNSVHGLFADTYGNLYAAGGNQNMGQPGVYLIDATNSAFAQVPYVGTEVNVIDVAFMPEPISMTVTSGEIDPMTGMPLVDAAGIPTVTIGAGLQPSIFLAIDAPGSPAKPYAVVISMLPTSTCSGGQPLVPPARNVLTIVPGEPRRLPLFYDELYLQSLIAAANGSGTIDPNFTAPVCPGATIGSALFFSGVLDATGHGVAEFVFPAVPCVPPGIEFYIGAAGVSIDSSTLPLGVNAISNIPACFKCTTGP